MMGHGREGPDKALEGKGRWSTGGKGEKKHGREGQDGALEGENETRQ